MYKFHAILSSLLLQILCIYVRPFIFISNFLFLWDHVHKVQIRKFWKLRHQNGRKLKSYQNKESKESNTNYNCKTMDVQRHLFTIKIADNYVCFFTLLSNLNNLSLHENVSSYLVIAHLELENACIDRKAFLFILKQILVNKCFKQVDIKSSKYKGNMTLKF